MERNVNVLNYTEWYSLRISVWPLWWNRLLHYVKFTTLLANNATSSPLSPALSIFILYFGSAPFHYIGKLLLKDIAYNKDKPIDIQHTAYDFIIGKTASMHAEERHSIYIWIIMVYIVVCKLYRKLGLLNVWRRMTCCHIHSNKMKKKTKKIEKNSIIKLHFVFHSLVPSCWCHRQRFFNHKIRSQIDNKNRSMDEK